MVNLTLKQIKKEILYFLRNSDVLTISERGVTTDSISDTLSSDTSFLINIPNVKNIRTLLVDAVPLSYNKDYVVNLNFDDSGTIKAKITFTTAQTGALTGTYDYGSDKVWDEYPRDDLSISSYPRVAFDFINKNKDNFGIGGNAWIINRIVQVVAYDNTKTRIEEIIEIIDNAVEQGNLSFSFCSVATPINEGPVIPGNNLYNEILQKNIDLNFRIEVQTK